jgi:hypothetical protein
MRTLSIVAPLVSLTLGALAGCKIDNRSLMMTPPGSGGGGGSGHGGSGGVLGVGGIIGSGGSTLATILLGDFENGTAQPQDTRFAAYQYYAYNPSFDPSSPPPGDSLSSPLVQPGYNSNDGLGLNWKVIDPMDGTPNYPGVGVRTMVRTGFVDLSGYDRIVFAQQYQHTGSCKALQSLTVFISCGELNTSYQGAVAVSPTWTISTLAFKSFVEPPYAPPSGHSLAECVALADGVVFQAQVDLADGDCASGSLSLDNVEIRAGGNPPGQDAAVDTPHSPGIPLLPDPSGYFDGSNAAGVVGAWGSAGDDYGSDGTPGTGDCPKDGFPQAKCSMITTPTPGTPFAPDAQARMCTSGIAELVAPGDGGQPAYAAIWGNFVFFDLNNPRSASDGGSDASTPDGGLAPGAGLGVYDAPAHGITGFAFDVDGTVSRLRVEFATPGTFLSAAWWEGASADVSPVNDAGHYEIRWADVGGPDYLPAPPAFDPSQLQEIRFHVASQASAATSYSYCIRNIVMLTRP